MDPDAETETQSSGPTEDGVVLEGTTADHSIRSDTEVTSPARLRWVLLGLAGLAAVVFGLSQWQRGEPTTDQEDSAADQDDSAENEEDGPDGDESDSAESALAESDTAAGSDGTTEPRGSDTSVEPVVVVPGSGPLLGEETGLALVIGNASTEGLLLLDLDSGTTYELAAQGRLVGVLGGHPVLQHEGSVLGLPLDTSDELGTELVPAEQGELEVVAVIDGAVWVVRQEDFSEPFDSDFSLLAYDQDGNQVRQQMLNQSSFLFGPPVVGELIQESGGGIYQPDGDGYRRVSTGSLVASGTELALVRECDEGRRCSYNWYQKSDWAGPLPFPSPDDSLQGRSWLGLHADDRWLVEHDWATERFRVIEVATGQVVREQEQGDFYGAPATFKPFSPDGRWLMADDDSGILIVDLENGTEFIYPSELAGPATGRIGVFVDLDDVGFVP